MDIQDFPSMEDRIIEAAKQVFVRKGYLQTTMSDVAKEAGIGRTALHYYYRTKEMLFDAIFGQLIGNLLPNVKKVMEEGGTMLEKIPKIIDYYTAVLYKNPLFPIFVISEINRDPEHLYRTVLKDSALIQPILQLRAQLEEEIEQGKLRKIPMVDIVSTVIGMLVFPMLVRNPLSAVFFDGDKEKFNCYIIERVPLVKKIVIQMLTPDPTK